MSDKIFGCSRCRKQVPAAEDAAAPRCCGRPMEPLPFCTSVPNPEMSRNYDEDEPCADGTTPKRGE